MVDIRKGQASIEFLTTYGWAIMAVIVAVSTLAYFGIISPSRQLPEKCLFGNGLTCRDALITAGASAGTGSLNITLVNTAGQTIYNLTFAQDGNYTATCSPSHFSALADQEFKVNCVLSSVNPSLVSGQGTKLKAKVTYKKKVDGYDHTSLGDIYSLVK